MRHRQPSLARSPLLAQRAAEMRSELNPAEAALWAHLKGRALGVMFRRQVVVLARYIADFLAPAAKVIVEVDGGYHARRERADARRDEKLRRAGYRVVRVPAELVLHAPAEAVALVWRALLVEYPSAGSAWTE
jgi:very-short-patch-repair endonuclease